MKKLGLYVHIPFCVQKCNYCDFLSFGGLSSADQDIYVRSLLCELDWYSAERGMAGDLPITVGDYEVDSIFIGGGTPSVISVGLMEMILNRIYRDFNVGSDAEITIEANPKTISSDKLKAYIALGINRLSIGAQSLDSRLLDFMGRIHTPEEFVRNYKEARAAGFQNINIDLMFGIPGQTLDMWTYTLKRIIELEPEHISFYSLKIEEGTPFYRMKEENILYEISDELDRDMYASALDLIKERSENETFPLYHHYEISNAAKNGFECRHNLKYWSMEEYLGIGLGAHSYINKERFSNLRDLDVYNKAEQGFVAWRHKNTIQDEISEFIFTGMRKINGIRFSDYEKKFGETINARFEKQVTKLAASGLIELTREGMRLTLIGIDLSNSVLSEFV